VFQAQGSALPLVRVGVFPGGRDRTLGRPQLRRACAGLGGRPWAETEISRASRSIDGQALQRPDRVGSPNRAAELRICGGAGDENRSRTVSLGICPRHLHAPPDLALLLSATIPEQPPRAAVNGTLMARRSCGSAQSQPVATRRMWAGLTFSEATPCTVTPSKAGLDLSQPTSHSSE
jgi:hypothetical protein